MDLHQIHTEDVFGSSLGRVKVKVNFGGLCVVYVWKNIFAVVFYCYFIIM